MLNNLEKLILKHEGLKLTPYVDTVGKLTIGIGRNLTDNGISKEEAIYLMRQDIMRCEAQLNAFSWYLNQSLTVQYALIDMCYNLGLYRLLGFKKMIKAIENKDYTNAALEALDSEWAKQVGDRAKDIAVMLREVS